MHTALKNPSITNRNWLLIALATTLLLCGRNTQADSPASESTNLKLILRQLNAIERVALTSQARPVQDEARYTFDYPRLIAEIDLIRQGIKAYQTPIRAQPLPQMDAPSRGEGANMIETFKNYMYDSAGLIGLVIAVAAFCGVAYYAFSTYAEVQTGKKTWGQFGLTVSIGGVLLVLIIWLLTKASSIL